MIAGKEPFRGPALMLWSVSSEARAELLRLTEDELALVASVFAVWKACAPPATDSDECKRES